MNAAEVIVAIEQYSNPPAIATLAETCPWCHQELRGHVLATFYNGNLQSVLQTRKIGMSDYTWMHSKESCCVPSLTRIAPIKK